MSTNSTLPARPSDHGKRTRHFGRDYVWLQQDGRLTLHPDELTRHEAVVAQAARDYADQRGIPIEQAAAQLRAALLDGSLRDLVRS